MDKLSYKSHDKTDVKWNAIYLSSQVRKPYMAAKDNRSFMNEVLWIIKTGAPWRGLTPDYGKWRTVYKRFVQ